MHTITVDFRIRYYLCVYCIIVIFAVQEIITLKRMSRLIRVYGIVVFNKSMFFGKKEKKRKWEAKERNIHSLSFDTL